MTRYEKLIEKSEKCRNAAKNTDGLMRDIWNEKARQLKIMAMELTLNEAMEIV